MMNKSSPYRNLIQFIPQTQADGINDKKVSKVDSKAQNCDNKIDGLEIKSFYEKLVGDEASKKSTKFDAPKKNKKRPTNSYCVASAIKKRPTTKDDHFQTSSLNTSTGSEYFNSSSLDFNRRQHAKLLQSSQLGDEANVKELLDKGLDVNFKDFYGWTPLMSAAKEGHLPVIKLLIKCGADKSIHNSSGYTALSLALNAGHSAVAEVLQSSDDTTVEETCHKHPEHDSFEVFYCNVCKRDFSQKESTSHQTSTVHLFNSGHKFKGPAYLIPDTNRGFQMMLRSGWDARSGLGPEGKGFKYPIKTVLKQDRSGIGGEDVKVKKKNSKITHFGPGDLEAVKFQKNPMRQLSVRKSARNAVRRKERKEKRWEQNLRFEMS